MSIPKPRVVPIRGPSYSIQLDAPTLAGCGRMVMCLPPVNSSPAIDLHGLCAQAVPVAPGGGARLVVVDAGRPVWPMSSTKSTETDVVTAGDRAAERLIRERLGELWPGVPVIGEEEGGSARRGRAVVGGRPDRRHGQLPVRVALVRGVGGGPGGRRFGGRRRGRAGLRAGLDRRSRGRGARLDGRPLRVFPPLTRLELSLVATGFAYSAQRRVRQAAVWGRMLGRVRDIRRAGASSLGSVRGGRRAGWTAMWSTACIGGTGRPGR